MMTTTTITRPTSIPIFTPLFLALGSPGVVRGYYRRLRPPAA